LNSYLGGEDKSVCLWNVSLNAGTPTMECQARIRCKSSWVQKLTWLPGDQLAMSSGKFIEIISRSGERLAELAPCDSTILQMEWSSALRALVAAAYGGIYLYDVEKTTEIPRKLEEKGSFLSTAVSGTPGHVVLAGGSYTPQIDK
jgi:WD40 repeat protein